MRKLFAVQILIFLLVVGSCSEQKTKHLILGKWQCANDTEVVFHFEQNNSLRTEITRPIKVYKSNLKFEIFDEKTIGFHIFENGKVDFEATLNGKNEFYLTCKFNSQINGRTIVDSPEFCSYKNFKRVE